jgi:hypothetical protein
MNSTNFSRPQTFDFTDLDSILYEQENEWKNGLTFGNSLMDGCLVEGAGITDEGGGLLPGDCTILLAPVNSGKSSSLINIAVANIVRGKNVLFVSHEGRELDLSVKMLQCSLGLTKKELVEWGRSKEYRDIILMMTEQFSKNFTFCHNVKAGNTVESVMNLVRTLDQDRKMQTGGKGYDLIIDDYPTVLTTEKASKGKLATREIHDIIYGNFVDLAGELKIHVVGAQQTNREGIKMNNRANGETGLIGLEQSAEAIGPAQRATNIITLNRPPHARINNYVAYKISKSRSSETGWVVVTETDFKRARTFFSSNNLKLNSIKIQHDIDSNDAINLLLKKYNGKGIEPSVYLEESKKKKAEKEE